jgi:hypothetical protein
VYRTHSRVGTMLFTFTLATRSDVQEPDGTLFHARAFRFLEAKSGESTFLHGLMLPILAAITIAGPHSLADITTNRLQALLICDSITLRPQSCGLPHHMESVTPTNRHCSRISEYPFSKCSICSTVQLCLRLVACSPPYIHLAPTENNTPVVDQA